MATITESHECSERTMLDVGDEYVCKDCGVVKVKEILTVPVVVGDNHYLESPENREMLQVNADGMPSKTNALGYTNFSLGSVMSDKVYHYDGWIPDSQFEATDGTRRGKPREPTALTEGTTLGYLKLVSDYNIKGESMMYECAKMIDRTSEKFNLPPRVAGEAVRIAKAALRKKTDDGKGAEWSAPTITAFSVITACKIHDIQAVRPRDVAESIRSLGHKVKNTNINEMVLETGIRAEPKRAEDYLRPIISKLSDLLRTKAAMRSDYLSSLLDVSKKALATIEDRAGRNPRAIAASCVYTAEIILARQGDRKKMFIQKEVGMCSGMAEYTVRDSYLHLFEHRIDDVFLMVMGHPPPPRPPIPRWMFKRKMKSVLDRTL